MLNSQHTYRFPSLRVVRTAKGLNLREVAWRADIDPAHLSRIERGSSGPGVDVLARLAAVLDLHELGKLLAPYLGTDE